MKPFCVVSLAFAAAMAAEPFRLPVPMVWQVNYDTLSRRQYIKGIDYLREHTRADILQLAPVEGVMPEGCRPVPRPREGTRRICALPRLPRDPAHVSEDQGKSSVREIPPVGFKRVPMDVNILFQSCVKINNFGNE